MAESRWSLSTPRYSKDNPPTIGAEARGEVEYPDGGYGWVIMIAYSLNMIFVLQISTVFGLILKNMFRELSIPDKSVATIMSFNVSISCLFGIFTGALVRRFGFRKVAVVGAVVASGGMALTALSRTSLAFIATYGVVMSVGSGLTTPAFAVALNSYFKRRRSLVTGVAMGMTGVSGVLLPHLVTALLGYLGTRGACLACAALALTAVVAALLLEPVEMHRPTPARQEDLELEIVSLDDLPQAREEAVESRLQPSSITSIPHQAHSQQLYLRAKQCCRWLVSQFGLGLLVRTTTMNLMLGLAVSNMADISFKTLVPFILSERKQDDTAIASFLSLLSGMASLGKLCAPLLHRASGLSSKGMYAVALVVLIAARTVLVMVTDNAAVLALAVVLGAGKGLRSVFYNLVIPDNVPYERLASAIGLQAAVTGLVTLASGPIIGYIRDYSGGYNVVIMTCNAISALCLIMWAVEVIIKKAKNRTL